MKRRGTGRPRFRITPTGRAVIAGVHYREMRHIFDIATVSVYDELKKEKGTESHRIYTQLLWTLQNLQSSLDESIQNTFPPTVTKKQPLIEVLRERNEERQFLDRILNSSLKKIRKRAAKRTKQQATQ